MTPLTGVVVHQTHRGQWRRGGVGSKGHEGRLVQSGGKGASHTVRSEFVDLTGTGIRQKDITCTVNDDACGQVNIEPRSKDAPRATRSYFVNAGNVTRGTVVGMAGSATKRLPALSKARP